MRRKTSQASEAESAEAERLRVLERYRRLKTEHDKAFTDLVGLAARLCEAPVALISLVGEGHQWFKASYGVYIEETLREVSFCAHTLGCPDLMIVSDTHKDPRFQHNPLVTGSPYIRFYAGAPLIDSRGNSLGALCVLDFQPRGLREDQGLALQQLARYVMAQLEVRYELSWLGSEAAGQHGMPGGAEAETGGRLQRVRQALQREVEARRELQQNLVAEQRFADELINSLPGIFYLLDGNGRLLRWNENTERALGRANLAGRYAADFFVPADRGRVRASIKRPAQEKTAFLEADLLHVDGSATPYYFGSSVIELDGERYLCGMGIEITEKRAAEEALHLRERAIEASVDAIIITECVGRDNPIVYVNPAFERITGYRSDEVIGRDPRFLQGEEYDQPELEHIRAALRDQHQGRAVARNFRKDGTPFWNAMTVAPVRSAEGELTHYVGVLSDISEARRYQEQLEYQANHDLLTGLANRNLLRDRLQQAIVYAQQYGGIVTTVLIDLDHFKFVNESLGHTAGDELLRNLADRLQGLVAEGDTLARHGGDEFVLVRYEPGGEVNSALLRQMLAEIAKPTVVHGRDLTLTSSLGVSVYPQDGEDADTLLKHADAAMYRAKESGRNNIRLYKAEMNRRVNERLTLEGRLRRALERERFMLYYQPQVDLRTGRMTGMEALLRWREPNGEWISPARFVPLAEETGLILPLGDWVLRTACRQNRAWQAAGLPAVPVAVNLSARQFAQPDLLERVEEILAESGLAPCHLEIELTESAFMHSVEESIATLERFKELGTCLAVDDFGTGYSSLSYLKRFPIDQLKIDQSFVRDITIDPDDAAITQAVISMGHSLDLKVIAEGVETSAQHGFLYAHSCDQLQGYYFSPPLPAAELAGVLARYG